MYRAIEKEYACQQESTKDLTATSVAAPFNRPALGAQLDGDSKALDDHGKVS